MADSLARRKLFLYKVESTKGTDAVPTPSADLILHNGDLAVVVPSEQDMGEGELKGTYGPGRSVTIKQAMSADITARVRALGQGTGALVTPAIHGLLMGSGHNVATAGNGTSTPRSATYTPTSVFANIKSATGYVYENGLLWKLLGAANDLVFEASMSALTVKAKPQSKYTAPTAVALPSWANPAQDFFRMTNALMTMSDGGTINIGGFTFDAGVKIEENYATGEHFFEFAGREPTIEIDPKAVDGSFADYTALTNCTEFALTATFSTPAGETLVFSAPKAVLMDITQDARASRNVRKKKYSLKEGAAGDDQYSMVWTAIL